MPGIRDRETRHRGGALQGLDAIASIMSRLLAASAALLLILTSPAAVMAYGTRATWVEALRRGDWAEAKSLAAEHADPLVSKVVAYYRLLAPGASLGAELTAFLSDNPDWPGQAQLAQRLADAVAAERSSPALRVLCEARASTTVLPRCPDLVLNIIRVVSPDESARSAWVRGVEPSAEAAFLNQWGRVLTTDDHRRRFDRLALTDPGTTTGPAARQAARLPPALRAIAELRLASRRDEPVTVPSGIVAPSLVLDLARWHRRAGRDSEAAKVLLLHGFSAEAAELSGRRAAYWDERNLLARRLLQSGDAATAYALVSTHAQAGEQALEAEFLAGWIALRRLNQPSSAARHFEALGLGSKAAITQGRANYWSARAAAAQGDAEAASAAYSAATAWPTTYYGQLAARALGDGDDALAARIAALRDPSFTAAQAQSVAARELARVAVLLAASGEPRRAKAFLHRLDEGMETKGERAAVARLASSLGLPEQAIALARRAGRDGLMLVDTGWPRPVSPPAGIVEQAVALGLIRQESSFDHQAGSPAGALGLMQLMPATAAAVARRLDEPSSSGALTLDPGYNMRLGTAYLRSLLDQFGGALPLALAGYNAGPGRVRQWLAANQDPRQGSVDMVDWIELIPFTETRNYVQRVLENVEIYRAKPDASGTQLAGGVE